MATNLPLWGGAKIDSLIAAGLICIGEDGLPKPTLKGETAMRLLGLTPRTSSPSKA